MKKLFIMLCVALTAGNLMASPPISQEQKSKGSAGVDEANLEELKTRESAIEKQEADVHMNQEEKEATKKQKAREGEAQGVEYDNKQIWNE